MRGLQARHDFTIEIIAFDKSYITASGLSDHIMGYISHRKSSDAFREYSFFPKSQVMYYTDEDDFAVALTCEIVAVET